MAKRDRSVFMCQQCGSQFSKWMGRCTECGQWNSVVEETATQVRAASVSSSHFSTTPKPLTEISEEKVLRWGTDLSEFDTVLGGGLVPGSLVLIGGEPGIGKSTLLLQVLHFYAKSGKSILYVSGEESPSQISLRAQRLKIDSHSILLASETNLEKILGHIEHTKPQILVIDSIQTVYSSELESQPGNVAQLRECTYRFLEIAKGKGIATFLVGHVTKEGNIAGPKVLEHMVDVVLYIEAGGAGGFRLLRSIKNRFGATNEVGVFEMISDGLKQVNNPSSVFLSEKAQNVPGSVISVNLEGNRPLLIEVQALSSHTSLAIPRRTAIGMDPNRLSLLVAILEKRAGYRFFDQDVYLNVAGGIRVNEPAVDLGVAAALLSSQEGKAVESDKVFMGELGLGGEIRSVPRIVERLKESSKIGMKTAYIPAAQAKELPKGMIETVIPVEHIQGLIPYIR